MTRNWWKPGESPAGIRESSGSFRGECGLLGVESEKTSIFVSGGRFTHGGEDDSLWKKWVIFVHADEIDEFFLKFSYFQVSQTGRIGWVLSLEPLPKSSQTPDQPAFFGAVS